MRRSRVLCLGLALAVALAAPAGTALMLAAGYAVCMAALMAVEYRPVKRTPDGARAHAILEETGKPRINTLLHLTSAGLLLPGAAFGGTFGVVMGGVALFLTIVGQFVHEKAWIEAGQAVPIS